MEEQKKRKAMAMEMGEGDEFGIYFGDEWMALFSMGGGCEGGRKASKVIWVSSWSH